MTTAVIQALATGLPVIATHHSGFPDQIHEGKDGFMVEEGDYEALAEKILYYMNHSEIWPDFGRYGKDLMIKTYDAKPLIDKQVALYKSILNE